MPILFCKDVVSIVGKKADWIIDPFGGTGTTMIVSQILKKKAYLIEYEEKYCDLIRRRWSQYAKDNNLEIGDGLENG